MKKNTASQVIGAQMVSATDGSAFTGSVTCSVTGDGGTQATGSVGSGACTHEGNGFHTYTPAQAETNYDHVAFTFTGTGAVPVTVQVYTGFPQTGDAFARLGAPAGASHAADIAAVKSDSAAIKIKTDNLPADPADASDIAALFAAIDAILGTPAGASVSADIAAVKAESASILADTGTDGVVISAATAKAIADALLGRSIAGGADGGRSVTSALRTLRNKRAVAAGVLTVYQEDDTTADHTAAVVTAAGDPIASIDPV